MKKLLSLVLALAMIATLGLSYADDENPNTITVTGLNGAVSAKYYKFLLNLYFLSFVFSLK